MIRSRWAAVPAAFAALMLVLGTPANAADPISVPVILPLTGGGAFIGQIQQKSLQILEDLVNKQGGIQGRPLKFSFLDDQTQPTVAKQLGSQAQTQSPIVLGSSLSAMCRAIAPVYETSGPVNYCLSPAIYPDKGSYVFSTSVSTKDLLAAMIRFSREKGWKRIAMVASQDASGQDGLDNLLLAMKLPENSGESLVATERYAGNDVSATAQMTRVKAANPQVMILWVPGTPFATGLHAMQDLGFEVPVMATSANMVAKQLEGYAGFMPKELYFPGVTYAANLAPNPSVKKQQDAYLAAMKAAGQPTDMQAGMPWDAGLIVVDALRKLGPNATGTQVRQYISSLSNWPGILGVYDFTKEPQRGVGMEDVVMMRWTGSGWANASSFGGALK